MEIREAIEILEFDLEVAIKWEKTVLGLGSEALIRTTKKRKEAYQTILSFLPKIQDAEMPKKKEGIKIKTTSVKCRLPENCSFPNCDCDEPETIIGTIMPAYNRGYNQCHDDFLAYHLKKMEEKELK